MALQYIVKVYKRIFYVCLDFKLLHSLTMYFRLLHKLQKYERWIMSAPVSSAKYWMCTVSRSHVLIGVEGGFCQACHGKQAPLAKMSEGDWIIYYSPKNSMEGKEKCQKFTAIGQIADKNIYKFEMAEGFVPFRRNVTYSKNVTEQPIEPLLGKLSFTSGKKNWGMAFRSGHFEIKKQDFDLISEKMLAKKV